MAGLINKWQGEIAQANKITANWPEWVLTQKADALTQLETMAEPNRKMETWRYSDSGKLFAESEVNGTDSIELEEIDADVCVVISAQGHEVVGEMPEWLSVSGIETLSADELISTEVKTHVPEQSMLKLNQALYHAGVQIKVGDNQQHPDFVVAVVIESDNSDWQFVRNQFVIGDNSQITINEIYAGGRTNQTAVWQVGRDAKVNKTTWSQFESEAVLVSFNQIYMSQNAEMKTMNYRFSGLLQHHNQQVEFTAERANYVSGSINKANNNSHIADIVNVFHNKKHNTSEVIHRSIADDKSQIFNNAKAIVAHGADHSEISQDLKNILLTDDAKIFSKPELEVSTDEVIAAHGSTIGALDESSLFYLQSRGIDAKQAKDIMIESFVAEAEVC